jgi:hypothetical protein
MTSLISFQIREIESIFPEMEEKPMTFECEMITLKQMIRQYCKEKGYYSNSQLNIGGIQK